jgi:signal transduction histidine kinase
MSEQQKLFKQTEEMKKELEHAASEKSEFLANMSHEIRAPLREMSDILEIISQTKLYEDCFELNIAILFSFFLSFFRLIEVLNDSLDLSKIKQNQMTLLCDYFDITLVFKNMISQLHCLHEIKKDCFTIYIALDTTIEYYDERFVLEKVLEKCISYSVRCFDSNQPMETF